MLVLFFRTMALLPLPILHMLGWLLGWTAYALVPSHRHRLRANLKQAGFEKHLCKAVGEAGKSMFELPFAWCASPHRIRRAVRIANFQLVEQKLAEGNGLIFITPHLGCFEITAQRVSQEVSITALYRPPRKAAFKPLVEGARANDNLALAPATISGVRQLLRTLKNRKAIGILPDQVPQNGEGVWASFFGRPAYTMTLPQKLHAMSRAPYLLTYAQRLSWGRGFVMHFVELDADDNMDGTDNTPVAQATRMNAAMEQLIATSPAQYNWAYDRYKKPAGVAPPDLSA